MCEVFEERRRATPKPACLIQLEHQLELPLYESIRVGPKATAFFFEAFAIHAMARDCFRLREVVQDRER